jgi:hypothetical protein
VSMPHRGGQCRGAAGGDGRGGIVIKFVRVGPVIVLIVLVDDSGGLTGVLCGVDLAELRVVGGNGIGRGSVPAVLTGSTRALRVDALLVLEELAADIQNVGSEFQPEPPVGKRTRIGCIRGR